MYILKEFPRYFWDGVNVIDSKSGKIKLCIEDAYGRLFYKLITPEGKWVKRSKDKVIALAIMPNPPTGFLPVPTFEGLFVSKDGQVWSAPSRANPLGLLLKHRISTAGYPVVNSKFSNGAPIEVHQLLARTFILADYVEQGLCVLHLDDVKTNYSLNNIIVGTYSDNNKQAYTSGLNPGNGMKKN